MGILADVLGAGMAWFAIVGARVQADQIIASRAAQLAAGAHRPAGPPPDAEPIASPPPGAFLSSEEYAAFAQATDGARDGYPTVAATDENLLGRVIQETQGIDQATLIGIAKENGQL